MMTLAKATTNGISPMGVVACKEDIYDANYEKLVSSPAEETKKLLSFCGLEWEDQCLDFYKLKKTPVQTVSVSQADKPIYKSSLNSSKGFSEYLDKMFNILDAQI